MARVGIRKGMRVLTFIVCWQVAAMKDGELVEIDVEEYAEYWKLARSTAFRDQAAFRQAFPTETTPHRIVEEVIRRREAVQTAQAPRWVLT
jgi:hypothetical protein